MANNFGMATEDLNFGITDFSEFQAGTFKFRSQAQLGMCVSELSSATDVIMNTIPTSQAFAGIDQEECAENEISLNASMPGIGTGRWTLVAGDTSGLFIANPEMAITPVEGLRGGNDYIFRWTLSNGACENYSSDEVTFNIINAELADAGEDIFICLSSETNLNASPPAGGQGRWTQTDVQRLLGVKIEDTNSPTTKVSGLEQGERYSFKWIITGSCGEFDDDVTVTTSDPEPFAGEDRIVCNDEGSYILEAMPTAESSSGKWESASGENIFFDNPADPSAMVGGLSEGDNRLVWVVDEGICGDISRDTVILNYTLSPKAEDDFIDGAFGKVLEFDLLANDFLPKPVDINIISSPVEGSLEPLGEGSFRYTPSINFVGTVEMSYEICGESCDCSEANIVLNIGENADCQAPNILTPNGDNINDLFAVPCLLDTTRFPESRLLVFNEWGDEVYRSAQPYNNDWDGTYDGLQLPVGTYFYILEYGNGRESDTGHVTIFR